MDGAPDWEAYTKSVKGVTDSDVDLAKNFGFSLTKCKLYSPCGIEYLREKCS